MLDDVYYLGTVEPDIRIQGSRKQEKTFFGGNGLRLAANYTYLAPPGQFFMGTKLFSETNLRRNKFVPKKNVKSHRFHGNLLYDFE